LRRKRRRKKEEGKKIRAERGQLEELQIPLPAEKKKRKITEKMGGSSKRIRQATSLVAHEETLEQMGS